MASIVIVFIERMHFAIAFKFVVLFFEFIIIGADDAAVVIVAVISSTPWIKDTCEPNHQSLAISKMSSQFSLHYK